MGVESFTTDEGVSVGIKNVVHASVTQEKQRTSICMASQRRTWMTSSRMM